MAYTQITKKFSLSSLSIAVFVVSIVALSFFNVSYAKLPKQAILLTINGAIGPATQDYVGRGLVQAAAKNAQLVILKIDTPGGLDKSMRKIIKDILSSSVPVVTYVAPSGARAASAGTYILYASHIAAMAPGTNLGAATPVQIGGATPMSGDKDKKKDKKTTKKSAMSQKITNDAVAYIRSLAQLRGRNVAWAEKAVREAASLPANEALKDNVIDIVAKNIPNLLQQLNGRTIIIQGQKIVLNTKGITLEKIEPDWRSRFLAVITDPSVAYILLLIGIYGLFFEFANPGFLLPGVAGAVCLLLALYAFQLLPINYAGLALILLGIAFMAVEAFMPSFGALGIGGIIAFVVGSILLLETGSGYSINWMLIFTMAALNAAFFLGIIGMALKARRRAVVSGLEELPGMQAKVVDDFVGEGWVRVHGETWKAASAVPLKKGQTVRVIKAEGLILTVEPLINVNSG